MFTFYEAQSRFPDHAVYRELLLTDCEATSKAIRLFRPRSWAVCAVRSDAVPRTWEEAAQDDDLGVLTCACNPIGPGQHRYDRVIIVQRGETDRIEGLVEFFRKWLPQVVAEKRLFLARVPEDLPPAEVERAIGAAESID